MRKLGWIILFGLVFVLEVGVAWRYNGKPCLGLDDANIFFSYAENMAAGKGIIYGHNPEPVEGFTSFLWLLVCAANFWLGLNEAGIFVCTCLCMVGAQCIWLALLRRKLRQVGAAEWIGYGTYGILILCSVGYVTWMTLTMMDTALWGLIFAGLTWVLLIDAEPETQFRGLGFWGAVAVFAAAALARPEAMYFVPIVLVLMFFNRRATKKKLGPIWLFGIVFLLVLSALFAFRLWYFGYPLPNTYYAKVSPSLLYNLQEGFNYAISCYSRGLPFGGALLVAACGFAWGVGRICPWLMGKTRLPEPTLWGGWFLVFVVQPILTGGDWFGFMRFYQPLYPMACGILAWCVSYALTKASCCTIHSQGNVFCWLAGYAILVLIGFNVTWVSMAMAHDSPLHVHFATLGYGQMLNRLFAETPDKPCIGVVRAGDIARSYEGPLVDMMGLNDVRIAHYPGDRKGTRGHAAFEPSLFEELGVELMPFSPIGWTATQTLKGLVEQEQFIRTWRYGHLSLKAHPEVASDVLIRASCVDRFAATHDFQDLLTWDGRQWIDVNVPGAPTSPES